MLAGSAVLVWELLNEPRTTDELIEVLAQTCRVDQSQIAGDVRAIVARFHAAGAIEVDDGVS
jgi:hypothetical protein